MYEHSRFTSESSNETNASGSTEQTDLSADDVISDITKETDARTDQASGYLDEKRYASSIDSTIKCKRNESHSKTEVENSNAEYYKLRENQRRHFGQDGSFKPHGESVPLLRTDRELLIIDIVRSGEFRKAFEHEHEDIVKLRKNYKSLKKIFLILSVLNIVLIICAVSVMPVILVSLRLEIGQVTQSRDQDLPVMEEFVFRKLESERAKEIILKHIDTPNTVRQYILSRIRNISQNIEQKFESDIQTVRDSIERLEDEVLDLQASKNNNNGTKQGGFQKTVVHKRVENNNRLLNDLLSRKRSSMQLLGTVNNGQIEWQMDVSNGNILSKNSIGIHVKSGGSYLFYTKIQFSKIVCTETEKFEYRIMKENAFVPTAYIKQHCSEGGSFVQPLSIQRLVRVPISETGTFYIKIHSVDLSFVSTEFGAHVFGIIEI